MDDRGSTPVGPHVNLQVNIDNRCCCCGIFGHIVKNFPRRGYGRRISPVSAYGFPRKRRLYDSEKTSW
jgi:hypothetical protein